jgi:hypothetical protein
MEKFIDFGRIENLLASFFDQCNCDDNSFAENENQQQNNSQENRRSYENVKPSFGFHKVRTDK